MGFQINGGGGSATLPSLGNILFVTETGSTTQSRADGLGRIDKPFELQKAFDVALPNDIIIIYGANSSITYSVSTGQLHIFMYCKSITIDFNSTSQYEIYCYNTGRYGTNITIQNIQNGRVNIFASDINLFLSNCDSLLVCCEQSCNIKILSSLDGCVFKSIIESYLFIDSSISSPNFSNLDIDNFNINMGSITPTFTDCTFNKSKISFSYNYGSNIIDCFFYDSKIYVNCMMLSSLNFEKNRFIRCSIYFSDLSPISVLNGDFSFNKFIDCVLNSFNPSPIHINNTTWILKDCIIHNSNSSISSSGFFNVNGTCNLYLIDCKYEVPASSPYAISNDYAGELQLINCQLPTNITGGKTPTVTSNVFIGALPNINDVLDNI